MDDQALWIDQLGSIQLNADVGDNQNSTTNDEENYLQAPRTNMTLQIPPDPHSLPHKNLRLGQRPESYAKWDYR